jgi:hypothetical protein
MGTLFVRNLAQKVLLQHELIGQLSDGYWENCRPNDHYKPWCRSEIVVAENDEEVGRDFYARKDNYNLSNKELFDIVGTRMLSCARLAKALPMETVEKVIPLLDMDGELTVPTHEGKYWDEKRAGIAELDVVAINKILNDDTLYSKKDLLNDLRDLKKIFRTHKFPKVLS